MRSGLLLTSLFSLIVFAGVANAQHAKVIDGTRLGSGTPTGQVKFHVDGTFAGVIVLSSDTTIGVSIPAGKTLRFKAPKPMPAGGATGAEIMSFYAWDGVVLSEPCGGAAAAQRTGSIRLTLQASGSYNDTVYSWKTDPAWKGTCRLLTARSTDGKVARVRVQFK